MEGGAGKCNGHVVFLSSPAMGHVIPFFVVAKRLVMDHGLHVTFLNITTTEASVAQNQLLHSPNNNLHVIDLPPADVSTLVTHSSLSQRTIKLEIIPSFSLPLLLTCLLSLCFSQNSTVTWTQNSSTFLNRFRSRVARPSEPRTCWTKLEIVRLRSTNGSSTTSNVSPWLQAWFLKF